MWLILILLAYFFLAQANFLDKYILGGSLPSPKIYSFFVGLLSLTTLFIVPTGILLSLYVFSPLQVIFPEAFDVLYIPELPLVLLGISAGFSFLFGLYFYYKAVFSFEVSRVGPAVGGLVPLFTLFLIYIFSFLPLETGLQKGVFTVKQFAAFIFLVSGSVILSVHKKSRITFKSLKVSIIASFLFSLSFLLTKLVYIFLPFWTGLIWVKMGSFVAASCFLLSPEVKEGLRKKRKSFAKKVALPFLLAKGAGSLGSVLQNGAIFLAPVAFLPFINALAGVQYVFLIIIATLFCFKFPRVLKEEISKKALAQKIIAILLIAIGLSLFALF